MQGARIKRIAIVAAAFFSALAAGCMEPTFDSKRLDRVITIDGVAPEWAGAEAYYDESEAYKLGFFNDDEYLYVYFATWSLSTQQQVAAGGLTVWFDGTGKRERTLGINYPQGMRRPVPEGSSLSAEPSKARDEMRVDAPWRQGEPAGGMPGASSPRDPAKLAAMLNQTQGEAVLKSPAGDSVLICAAGNGAGAGIAAMLHAKSRLLVIELRVPLDRAGESPYAIHAAAGDAIGVGFESGAMEIPKRFGPEGMPDDGMPPGGAPSGGGMQSGGEMAPGGMRGAESAATIKLWAKVKLAP